MPFAPQHNQTGSQAAATRTKSRATRIACEAICGESTYLPLMTVVKIVAACGQGQDRKYPPSQSRVTASIRPNRGRLAPDQRETKPLFQLEIRPATNKNLQMGLFRALLRPDSEASVEVAWPDASDGRLNAMF
jgi:hypothetical protein